MTIKITKQLATMEDLAIGTGTVVQERNGVPLTLTKIDLNSRISRVKSVADMKALPVVLDSAIQTLGYYSSGDGGGNTYEIVAAGSGTDDGGSFIDLDNGLQAKGIFSYEVSIAQFGASSNSLDVTSSIQNAVNYSDYVAAPAGNFTVLGTVTKQCAEGVDFSFIGAGPEATNFLCSSNFLQVNFESNSPNLVGNSSLAKIKGFACETANPNFNLTAVSVDNVNSLGTQPVASTFVNISDISGTPSASFSEEGWGALIKLTNVSKSRIDNISFIGQNFRGNAIELLGFASPVDNVITRVNCQSARAGVHVVGEAEGVFIDHLVAVGMEYGVYYLGESAPGVPTGVPLLIISNSHINVLVDGGACVYTDSVVNQLIDSSNLFFVNADNGFGIYSTLDQGSLNMGLITYASIKNPRSAINTTGVYLGDGVRDTIIGGSITEQETAIRIPPGAYLENRLSADLVLRNNTQDYDPSGRLPHVVINTTFLEVGRVKDSAASRGIRFFLDEDTVSGGGMFIDSGALTVEADNVMNFKTNGITRHQIFNNGDIRPFEDNAYALGAPTERYRTIFSDTFKVGNGVATISSGSGSPEGVINAGGGSMYLRRDGTASTTLYVKVGSGNTGWSAR